MRQNSASHCRKVKGKASAADRHHFFVFLGKSVALNSSLQNGAQSDLNWWKLFLPEANSTVVVYFESFCHLIVVALLFLWKAAGAKLIANSCTFSHLLLLPWLTHNSCTDVALFWLHFWW